MTETILEIKNLKKSYGKNEVLKDISLSVKKVMISLPIVRDSVWCSNPSTSLKTLMSWKMLS